MYVCENIGIGAWDVRTLSYTGALALAVNELKRYRWDIVDSSDSVRQDGVEMESSTMIGTKFDHPEEKTMQEGVAMILNKKSTKALIGYQLVSQLLVARFRTKFTKMAVMLT